MADLGGAAIVGVGYTPIVRRSDCSLGSVAVDAAIAAIEDAGLRRDDIDGYIGTPFGPAAGSTQADGVGYVSAGYLASALGLPALALTVDIVGLPSTSLVLAIQALASGLCHYVLLLRAIGDGQEARPATAGRRRAAGPDQFALPFGLPRGVGQYALGLQRYMHEYGATREELFAVVKAARRHARLSPVAYWRDRDVTLDEYLSARFVYEPLCLLDCDLPVTTAGAVIVTTAERARDLRHKPALISGVAGAHTEGPSVFEVSGVPREEVDVAQIYDGYSPFVWYWLEYLDYCRTGEAHSFALDGRIELGGELPVNTFGGNLGEGHFQGFGHLREGAMQVMGRCGARQVAGARNCVVAIGQPTGARSRYALMLSAG